MTDSLIVEKDSLGEDLSPEEAAKISSILDREGIAVFPTDTVYGIGCRWDRPGAIDRLYEIKGRPESNPLPLLADRFESCLTLGDFSVPGARELALRFWPGPLTLLTPPRPGLSGLPAAILGDLIGFRLPDCAIARSIARLGGGLLASSSANESGRPPMFDPQEIPRFFSGKADVIITVGIMKKNANPSTVAACEKGGMRILREGALSAVVLMESLPELFSSKPSARY